MAAERAALAEEWTQLYLSGSTTTNSGIPNSMQQAEQARAHDKELQRCIIEL
jgi:hypothetical protein